jgi:Arc/MetJ-type ribon-helix-helix transcriptional regulator
MLKQKDVGVLRGSSYTIKYGIIITMNSVSQYQTTTIRLPKDLYEQARTAVKDAGAASSINDFLVAAVEEKLQQLREQEIDAAFAEMAHDPEYQKSAIEMAKSFERSDWEAYQVSEAAQNADRTTKTRSTKTKAR